MIRGKIEFDASDAETVTNPALLVEVLAPESEAYDREAKFAHYQRLPSLEEYVLVAQDRALVEHYAREGEVWQLNCWEGLDSSLSLRCVKTSIPLTGIYDRVMFPENPGR
ncbi:MAG: Uma2 family endonuclease [Actinomycetota bacterium]